MPARLTDDEREERRITRNAKKREKYRIAREEELLAQILGRTREADTRNLIDGVFTARPKLTGLLRSKAEYIILMWKENMPKVGWKDDALEIIAAAGGEA